MKTKEISFFSALLLAVQVISGGRTISALSEKNLYGDCNNDGKVNVFDNIRIKRDILSGNGIETDNKIFGDCNNDLKITWSDYFELSEHILEKKNLSDWSQKGWSIENDHKYYYNKGQKLIGDQNIFGQNYKFKETGDFLTGLYNFGGSTYFSDDHGFPQGGWRDIDNNRYYFDNVNGKAFTGNIVIENGHYYFDDSGVMKTDWQNLSSIVDTSDALYTYDIMTEDVNRFSSQYPGLIRVNVLAQTYDQRNIYDIVFGNPQAQNQIVIQASCHGREYMTSQLVMNQLEFYLKNYYSLSYNNESFESIFSNVCIHIIPMLNPDGVSISQFGADIINNLDMRAALYDMYRYDYANKVTSLSMAQYFKSWKSNARGVDINRNFNTYWTNNRAINRPSSSIFAGECAESERETQVLRNLINSLPSVRMVVSYHSSGSYVYWAYGQTGEFRARCLDMARTVQSVTGYNLLQSDDYDSGCSNWASSKGIIAETIEIGKGDSPLSANEFGQIWERNRYVWAAIAAKY